jgi:hypothetical protein
VTVVTLPTIITATDVEDAVFATLKPRLTYYLDQLGYPDIRRYTRKVRFTKWPEDRCPAVIVRCPGTAEDPTRRSAGHDARWAVGVAAIVSANTEENTDKAAKLYGGLIRAILLQEGSLHGFARGTDWVGESFDEIPSTADRTLGSAECLFWVEVENVVNAKELPLMPGGPLPNPTDFVITESVINVENTQEVTS